MFLGALDIEQAHSQSHPNTLRPPKLIRIVGGNFDHQPIARQCFLHPHHHRHLHLMLKQQHFAPKHLHKQHQIAARQHLQQQRSRRSTINCRRIRRPRHAVAEHRLPAQFGQPRHDDRVVRQLRRMRPIEPHARRAHAKREAVVQRVNAEHIDVIASVGQQCVQLLARLARRADDQRQLALANGNGAGVRTAKGALQAERGQPLGVAGGGGEGGAQAALVALHADDQTIVDGTGVDFAVRKRGV